MPYNIDRDSDLWAVLIDLYNQLVQDWGGCGADAKRNELLERLELELFGKSGPPRPTI